MRIAPMALLCTLGLTALGAMGAIGARAVDKAEVEKELKKFQGTWTFASLEEGGKVVPPAALKGNTFIFEGDKYTIKNGDAVVQVATLKLDPSKSPKTFDVTATVGPQEVVISLGIYEISGDTLKLCYVEVGKKRPTEFKTAVGSQTTLAVLKRVKK